MSQSLILEVSGRHSAQFGPRARKVFEQRGGSIGRSEDCDWVLAASGVSRVHAMVRLLNGYYFIEDRSTNGMLLNGTPLMKGEPAVLGEGDRLTIDTIEIAVHIGAAAASAAEVPPPPVPTHLPAAGVGLPGAAPAPASAPLPADPFDFDLLVPAPSPAAPPPAAGNPSTFGGADAGSLIPGWNEGAAGGDDLDPLSFLGPAPAESPFSTGNTGNRSDAQSSWNHTPSAADSFRPPTPVPPPATPLPGGGPGGAVLPDNWDLTMGNFGAAASPSPPRPAAPPVPPPASLPGGLPPPMPPVTPAIPPAAPLPQMPPSVAAAAPPLAVMAAPVAVPAPAASAPAAAMPADLDRIFRTVVDGVMEVLRARAEIKNTFRLPVTIIQRSENNPLKFAPTPEDALARILAPPSPGFLSGPAAFDDAFNDIRCHQMAMLAGMRAAFDTMVQQFAPERFETESDSGRRGGFLDFAGKGGKQWERYREQWDAMSRNPDERFRRLFGEEFAKAYEEQLARLKSARRQGGAAR